MKGGLRIEVGSRKVAAGRLSLDTSNEAGIRGKGSARNQAVWLDHTRPGNTKKIPNERKGGGEGLPYMYYREKNESARDHQMIKSLKTHFTLAFHKLVKQRLTGQLKLYLKCPPAAEKNVKLSELIGKRGRLSISSKR